MERRAPDAQTLNRQKLKRLVHYICHKVDNPTDLGKTKLNKILFFTDFQTYLETGESATGETYIKFQHGPVSDHIQEVLRELEDEGALVTREKTYHGYPKKEYISLTAPDLDLFSGSEISIADEFVEEICRNHSATSISDASHNHIWEAAEIGEEIPYEAFFVYQLGEIGPDDVGWAQREIERRTDPEADPA
jgi:hypothetical protein